MGAVSFPYFDPEGRLLVYLPPRWSTVQPVPYHSTEEMIEKHKGRKLDIGGEFHEIKCPHLVPLSRVFPKEPDWQLRGYLESQGYDTSHYDDPVVTDTSVRNRLWLTSDGWKVVVCGCGTLYYGKVA